MRVDELLEDGWLTKAWDTVKHGFQDPMEDYRKSVKIHYCVSYFRPNHACMYLFDDIIEPIVE